jgi:hypothetical protein
MKKLVLAAAIAAATTSACTTTQRVSVVQPGDRTLSCTQLRDQFVSLEEIIRDGQSDQGVNGANVAAVLFFWPAAVGNYMSARDAMQIAERRKEHLMTIYNEKQCDNPNNADLRVRVPAELLAPIRRG